MLAPESIMKNINPGVNALPWAVGGGVYIGGALIYAFRVPEKHYPKKFDHCGSSHNIFHVAVLLGCSIHFNASMLLYRTAHTVVCPK